MYKWFSFGLRRYSEITRTWITLSDTLSNLLELSQKYNIFHNPRWLSNLIQIKFKNITNIVLMFSYFRTIICMMLSNTSCECNVTYEFSVVICPSILSLERCNVERFRFVIDRLVKDGLCTRNTAPSCSAISRILRRRDDVDVKPGSDGMSSGKNLFPRIYYYTISRLRNCGEAEVKIELEC